MSPAAIHSHLDEFKFSIRAGSRVKCCTIFVTNACMCMIQKIIMMKKNIKAMELNHDWFTHGHRSSGGHIW